MYRQPQPPDTPQRPKVVYVMGAGRSGSTILGVALGNCDGVFYAGELDAWFGRRGAPNFGGEERQRFWRRVAAGMVGATDLYGDEPRRYIEHSSAMLRARPWRPSQQLRRRYREVVERLFRRIAEDAATSHVVDSSHYPLRARELQRIEGIDLYLVYLVRSPQTVVASFLREDVDQPSKGRWAANLYLWITHLLSAGVFMRQPRQRRLFLRYEEFAAEPSRVLAGMQEWMGLAASAPDLAELKTGVAFQGNRLLRQPTIEFRSAGPRDGSRDWVTLLLQSPWRPVMSCLRPAVEETEQPVAAIAGNP